MEPSYETPRDLSLLDNIEHHPDVTQADLAAQLGMAVGTVNWHLKRLISKGYVKVMRAERRKLRYLITPAGLVLRTRLTMDYVEQQFNLYRRVRQKVKEYVEQVKSAGFDRVQLVGAGDVADICRLTCLEQNIIIAQSDQPGIPTLEVRGLSVTLIKAEEI